MLKIHVDAANTKKANEYAKRIAECFDISSREEAEIIVVLGGDGFMLDALHRGSNLNLPFYGIHCGTVGFLMNAISLDNIPSLMERLEKATITKLNPLKMTVVQKDGKETVLHAINEVTLQRQTYQACKLSVAINGKIRLEKLIGDGIIVSTAAGSTAYNFSANGPIIPLGIPLLALTPLNPFQPKHWRGAIIPNTAHLTIEVIDAENRSVEATADNIIIKDVIRASIQENPFLELHILFDPDHNLEERILIEQFFQH
ncbi:MAG: NAD kinase [Candidatus Paracaedibacteraceae bacterium]|nr:NAD kinase [Candidatus Paracaedibacteraceae bacterium]